MRLARDRAAREKDVWGASIHVDRGARVAKETQAEMRRNVKIVLFLSCAWMFAFVYYYHTSRDTKVSRLTRFSACT